MSHDKYRIAANVPLSVRSMLLDLYKPRFTQVLARSITWAYDVPADFAFDRSNQEVTIDAIHHGDQHEAFIARLGTADRQHDGLKSLHLTLSIAHGIKPVQAGDIRIDRLEWIPHIRFTSKLEAFPLWDMARIGKGTRKAA
jgi:hypothetical protein